MGRYEEARNSTATQLTDFFVTDPETRESVRRGGTAEVENAGVGTTKATRRATLAPRTKATQARVKNRPPNLVR